MAGAKISKRAIRNLVIKRLGNCNDYSTSIEAAQAAKLIILVIRALRGLS
jgi:hypothetical protein